jgi:hypothetical protein
MMRFLVAIVLMILLSAVAEYLLSWWSLAIVCFIVSILMKLNTGKAFLSGMIAIILLWTAWTLYYDLPNEHLLSGRMATVFSLPNTAAFIIVTALVGGIAGGLSAWSGAHLSRMLMASPKN